jgi:putative Mn2+ efflux pump MntP
MAAALIPALIMAFGQFICALLGTCKTKICCQFPSVINFMINSVFFSLAVGYTFE